MDGFVDGWREGGMDGGREGGINAWRTIAPYRMLRVAFLVEFYWNIFSSSISNLNGHDVRLMEFQIDGVNDESSVQLEAEEFGWYDSSALRVVDVQEAVVLGLHQVVWLAGSTSCMIQFI